MALLSSGTTIMVNSGLLKLTELNLILGIGIYRPGFSTIAPFVNLSQGTSVKCAYSAKPSTIGFILEDVRFLFHFPALR